MRFFLNIDYLEEIEGDMEEVYYDNLKQYSKRTADCKYTLDMLQLIRPSLISKHSVSIYFNWHLMFKNYFKISIRGLLKNPLNSFINVFGLAIALGFCVFAYTFANWTYKTDQFHEKKNEIFLTTFYAERDGSLQQYGLSPRQLGETLQEDFAPINNVCNIEDRQVIVKYKDNVFNERVRLTDAAFLEMFTFPLKWGVSESLEDINSIILSEEMSRKYFGEDNSIGQDLMLTFGKEQIKLFKVTGVAKAFPESRSFDFDFLINFKNLRLIDSDYDFHDWKSYVSATFIQVNDISEIPFINQEMEKYIDVHNQIAHEDWAISSFKLEPLATLHKNTEFIRDDIAMSSWGNLQSIIFLSVIAVFMLTLACSNYINIAIVSAAKRLNEIGVRKTIGATRKSIIIQFLSENIVITSFALIIGLFIGITVFITGFEQMWQFSMDFRWNDTTLWIFLLSILLITSFLSGIYPSLYISKFQVIGILKGNLKFGKKNPVTKVFLCLQLVLACVFITSAVMFTLNSNYLAKRSWGYNQSEVIYAKIADFADFEKLKKAMLQHPNVLSASGSVDHLGKSNSSKLVHFVDREIEVDQLEVDANYFKTMGLTLLEGRIFNKHVGSDKNSVIVNELMVKNMMWQQPIGEQFKMDSIQYEVVGVVKDFHSYSFFNPVHPTIFKVTDENKSNFQYLSLKVKAGSEKETYLTLQNEWLKLFPETPFNGGYQEDVWGNYFEEIKIHGKFWQVIAILAVILASLGLYGLMSLNITGRLKEFSIRKVLGAGVKNISENILRQYLLLFIIALVIGAPLSQFLLKTIFDASYTYHIPVTYSGVAIAVGILIFVLSITVLTQIFRAVNFNPVKGLKSE